MNFRLRQGGQARVYNRWASFWILLAALPAQSFHASAQIDPNSPTTVWTPVEFASGTSTDPSKDQQGSAENDIVGNATQPSLFTIFDQGSSASDSTIGFRLRLGADANAAGFKGAAFIGIDGNLDGVLDIFVGVDNHGSADSIGIWNTGAALNISPGTTLINSTPLFSYGESSLNYSFQDVTAVNDPFATSFDLNGDKKTDQFLTFVVSLNDISSALASKGIAGFSASSPMQLVIATATQASSLNGDILGVNGSLTSLQTWDQLGAISLTIAPNGVSPVPEPSSTAIFCAAGVLILFRSYRSWRS